MVTVFAGVVLGFLALFFLAAWIAGSLMIVVALLAVPLEIIKFFRKSS